MSDQDKTVKISAETWSKLQTLNQTELKDIELVVEEAVQAYLKNLETGSLSHGQPQNALRRPEATFKPQTHLRQIPVVPGEAAVLFIDVQNYNCHKDGAEMQGLPPVTLLISGPSFAFYLSHYVPIEHGIACHPGAPVDGPQDAELSRGVTALPLLHHFDPTLALGVPCLADKSILIAVSYKSARTNPCRTQRWIIGGRGWRKLLRSGCS